MKLNVAAVMTLTAEVPPTLTQDHACVDVLYRSAPVVQVGMATAVGEAELAEAFIATVSAACAARAAIATLAFGNVILPLVFVTPATDVQVA